MGDGWQTEAGGRGGAGDVFPIAEDTGGIVEIARAKERRTANASADATLINNETDKEREREGGGGVGDGREPFETPGGEHEDDGEHEGGDAKIGDEIGAAAMAGAVGGELFRAAAVVVDEFLDGGGLLA